MRIAYLVGNYPAVSHTFIAREVEGLRARGVDVRTFSIRPTPPELLLTDADRRAAQETWNVLPPDPGELVAAHWRAFSRRPLTYLRTLVRAIRTSPGGARNDLWHLFYFAEAALVWDRCRREGITHLHAHFANVATVVCMLASQLGRRDGLTWSFTMHGSTEFYDVIHYALPQKYRDAAAVVVISDYGRSQVMKLVEPEHWHKIELIHCGVDPSVFAPPDRAPAADRLRVLCVGRLVPDKGTRLLVEALG